MNNVGVSVQGQAFINDFNLGRYWPIKGPQVTLYVPAPTLTASSENRLFMFELENSPCNSVNSYCQVSFVDVPFIDAKPSGTDLPVKTSSGWDSHTLH